MEIDLRRLLMSIQRWWWLFVLLPIVAGGLTFIFTTRQPPRYLATATLLINPAPIAGASDLNAITAGQRLAATYQQLVVTEPVIMPALGQLGLSSDFETMKKKITAAAARDTQLLRISVSDTDSRLAATIANTIAQEFASFIQQQMLTDVGSSRLTLQQLIDETERQLNEARQQLQNIGENTADNEVEVTSLRSRIDRLEQSYADLLVQAQTMDLEVAAMQSQVRVAVPASIPTAPYTPRVLFSSVFAGLLGFIAAIGTVGLLEYLDNTVKTQTGFARRFGVPLLATVQQLPNLESGPTQLYVHAQQQSVAAESIRLLRTNLEFAAAASEISTLAITSVNQGDGKSTIAANLALAMAHAGFTTMLVDADLRQPSQHVIWRVANDRGLTTLLSRSHEQWHRNMAVELAPNLTLIPSGPIPPNPAELLGLDRFRRLLDDIRQVADIIVIDSPPTLAVSDPLIVARNADAVLVVARANRTRVEALQTALASLSQGNVRIAGVVLNRDPQRQSAYGYSASNYGSRNQPVSP